MRALPGLLRPFGFASFHGISRTEPEDLGCTAELLRRAFFQRVLAETVS